ncbi:unnamed protein product [Cuscuta campestris]|uniref:Uncharacterized protein n=1 Tax=Cuscuta campestris TaxID=132261 RepID=A0A484NKB4_9ASTE|nr:unnamed protein product [Cuscuta campestris]
MENRIPISLDEVRGTLENIGIGEPVKPKENFLQILGITQAESELSSIDPPSLEMLCYLWLSETSLGIPFEWEVPMIKTTNKFGYQDVLKFSQKSTQKPCEATASFSPHCLNRLIPPRPGKAYASQA